MTAWLESAQGPLGLQVTFFRSRTPYGRENPSRFAPEQLVLAHAALAMPDRGTLLHDQQAWREDSVAARFSANDTKVTVGLPNKRWEMVREASDQYIIAVKADGFGFQITASSPPSIATPVLQGKSGFSQKGPHQAQSSYYYSRPQLLIDGEIDHNEVTVAVTGTGWLDHEWSSELLDENAAGWDWVGLNFHDGSALMVFQMRARAGGVLYTAGKRISIVAGDRNERDLSPHFSALRYWQSPRTQARYPVSTRLQVGELDLTIEPLFDDQELDSRGSTGVIYWEGAVQVWNTQDVEQDGSKTGERVATGYLELTGYAGELTL